MIYKLFIICLFFFFVPNQDPRNLTIFVSNDLRLTPFARDEISFWGHTNFLDTIEIRSSRINKFILNEIELLEPENIEYEFSISTAIIIPNQGVLDTLYADDFLKSWKINNKNYIDKRGNLRKMIGGFFLFNYMK